MARRIIIYDDDTDILMVTSVILKRKGYEVVCREDCTDLLKDLAAFQPDVILMDNWMPMMTGVEAIRQIKITAEFKNIPVIFFSANSNLEALAIEAGADKLLKKPFEMLTLQQLIDELLPA